MKLPSNSKAVPKNRTIVVAVWISVCVWQSHVILADTKIDFDAGDQVACRDITSQEFANDYPGDRLLEATFEISTLFHGDEKPGIELFYQIFNPSHSIRIVDFSPSTHLISEFAGNISHEKKSEKHSSIGANATANIQHFGVVGANLGGHKRNNDNVTYQKLAPKQLLTASGTISRASGVYFKLKTSNQTTLEGSRKFVVRFRVPNYWSGDVIQIHCRARKRNTSFGSSGQFRQIARADFLVATYVGNDASARRIAESFTMAESDLRNKAKRLKDEIARRSYSNPLERLGGALKIAERDIPENWLGIVLFENKPKGEFEFYRQMPVEIKKSIDKFISTKRQMIAASSRASARR